MNTGKPQRHPRTTHPSNVHTGSRGCALAHVLAVFDRCRCAMPRAKWSLMILDQKCPIYDITRPSTPRTTPETLNRRSTPCIPCITTPGPVPGLSLVPPLTPLMCYRMRKVDLHVLRITASYRSNSFNFQYYHAPGVASKALHLTSRRTFISQGQSSNWLCLLCVSQIWPS